jgi:hypothetical protein
MNNVNKYIDQYGIDRWVLFLLTLPSDGSNVSWKAANYVFDMCQRGAGIRELFGGWVMSGMFTVVFSFVS